MFRKTSFMSVRKRPSGLLSYNRKFSKISPSGEGNNSLLKNWEFNGSQTFTGKGHYFATFTPSPISFYSVSQKRVYSTVNNVETDYKSPIRVRSLDNVKNDLFNENPEWFQKLITKQKSLPLFDTFKSLTLQNRELSNNIQINSNLQHVLSYLTYQKDEESSDYDKISEDEERAINYSFKSLHGSQSVESAFVIILHTILKIKNPVYTNPTVSEYLINNARKYDIKPSSLFISKELSNESIFGTDFDKIISDENFQIAVQILKIRLKENKGWMLNHESRDDNILVWIESLFEPSINKCLISLTKAKYVPDIILYDLLLRVPSNELEYKYFFEFYKSFSTELNLIDQEKLYHFKQFDSSFDRKLIIPPLFNNFFSISLRSKLENLPILIDLFLNENNISSIHTLEQISEMIWYLSYDQTGEHALKPSRYCSISQSKLIKTINSMTQRNKSLEADVTTMLGISNLSYYRDFKKSYHMFKNAKKQFDQWQLTKFKPKEFKKIGINKSDSNENITSLSNSDLLYNIKVDYNIKFLCNSVLLLSVNSDNEEMISQDLSNIFKKIEPEILIKYPEIWQFVLIKLNFHKMLNEQTISMLIQEYLKHHQNYGTNNYFVLDVLINNTQKVKTLTSLINNLKIENLDDNNISHLISKFYKFAKNNSSGDDDTYNCLGLARELYNNSKFKSTRLNSSHLLGESIFSPEETFVRYNSINDHFKITQLSISSLFVSIYKLYETDKYKEVKWGVNKDIEPLDFAISEFDKHISHAYGDTSEGMLYPNDNLLAIYIKVLERFGKSEELHKLLQRLVDLKYPLGKTLFNTYLNALNDWDRNELIKSLNAYDSRFHKLLACKNEFTLKRVKAKLPMVRAKGSFEEFVSNLEFNWGIVRYWNWPSRRKYGE